MVGVVVVELNVLLDEEAAREVELLYGSNDETEEDSGLLAPVDCGV